MFVVPRETPGVEIQPEPRNHNHIIYNDVRVPLDHLLGPEDGAKVLAQRRLGGGRIHHAMRTIAQCKLAFDMMCERALSRESHGKIIAEHQMVQEKIADSYASIRMLRLFVLETAWKIDNTSTQETRTDIAAVKYTMAKVLREVSFNALHILGSLGTTNLTPLQAMYAGRADDGHRRRRRRGAQGHRRPQRAQGLPAARGLLADRVLPGQASEGPARSSSRCSRPTPSCASSPTATRSTSPPAASPRPTGFLVDPPSHRRRFDKRMGGMFETKVLPSDRDVVAPDGSDVRMLLGLPGGTMAHFELAPGAVSTAVRHRTVEEIWYVVSGWGSIWRRLGDDEQIVDLDAGICVTIPVETEFQFRCDSDSPLRIVAITMPPWPGDDEATRIPGPWRPTV